MHPTISPSARAVLAFICAGCGIAATHAATVATPPPLPCALRRPASLAYLDKIVKTAHELKVSPDYPLRHRLTVVPQASSLVVAEDDIYGYPLRLAQPAASALRAMQAAASRDQVVLQAVSGYRSFADQLQLVKRHLREGLSIRQTLRINDLPGFSEHQSGCAVDLTTPGVAPVTVAFGKTPAYRWLVHHAAGFGFHLSYGRDNDHDVEFEPWHWRFTQDRPAADNATIMSTNMHQETAGKTSE